MAGAGPVLLWGPLRDTPLAAVCTALARLGTPMFFVVQARVLDTELLLHGDGSGRLRVGDHHCALQDLRSAYLRADASAAAAGLEEPESQAACRAVCATAQARRRADQRHAQRIDDGMAQWLALTPARVVNPLPAMASNGSKPYQTALISAAGFAVPDTLLTNDLDALRQFSARHGPLVYKSTSGVRSIVARLDPGDVQRLARLATCPTQFQPLVPGIDHRLHVIGDEVFGHRIQTEAVDYRYAAAGCTTIARWPVPTALADRARALAVSLGLALAGIDLRLTPDGDWVCFEVNPSPGFSFFEDDDVDDAQSMATAVARLLCG